MADQTIATCVSKSGIKARKYFRWEPEHIDELLTCMLEFKTKMLYNCKDFDADKPLLYSEIRTSMAKLHPEGELFGLVEASILQGNLSVDDRKELTCKIKIEKEMIAKGRNRIMEKIKETRQNFAKAVVSGTRSGSGGIVFEHYDRLVEIWGGSANTQPLSFGVAGEDFNVENSDQQGDEDANVDYEEGGDNNNTSSHQQNLASPSNNFNQPTSLSVSDASAEIDSSSSSSSSSTKRKAVSCVSRLVDNKRKHLEKNLSAAQRDKLLIDEAKDDVP